MKTQFIDFIHLELIVDLASELKKLVQTYRFAINRLYKKDVLKVESCFAGDLIKNRTIVRIFDLTLRRRFEQLLRRLLF